MKFLLSIFLLFISQCLYSQNEDSIMLVLESTEISSLKSTEERTSYLKNVFLADQGIRTTELEIHATFGYKSPEHDSILKRWAEIDRFLLNSIILYLEIHPYPTIDMGKQACYTPFLILHHASGDETIIELKKKYFTVLYNANQNESLESGALWMYLYRLFQDIQGELYDDMDLGEADQIDDMINLLGLKRK